MLFFLSLFFLSSINQSASIYYFSEKELNFSLRCSFPSQSIFPFSHRFNEDLSFEKKIIEDIYFENIENILNSLIIERDKKDTFFSITLPKFEKDLKLLSPQKKEKNISLAIYSASKKKIISTGKLKGIFKGESYLFYPFKNSLIPVISNSSLALESLKFFLIKELKKQLIEEFEISPLEGLKIDVISSI